MRKPILLTGLFILLFKLGGLAQTSSVFTSDIDNFWNAYDSATTTTDTIRQLDYIQRLYIDKATEGLKLFMKARRYSAKGYVDLINKYPKFWHSVRPNTLTIKNRVPEIEAGIAGLKRLYPEMRPATMYFTIGGLRSGGTTNNDKVLIGAEITTADKNTDASELSDWLKNVFKNQDLSELVVLNVHEYVHTQQQLDDQESLIGNVLSEGAAVFMAELATGIKDNSNYMIAGRARAAELKEKFKNDVINGAGTKDWLYNGNGATADLGYYMGYNICNAWYQHTKDKKKAVKEIIELNYANDTAALDFLIGSKFYEGNQFDKTAILTRYENQHPTITSLTPDLNGKKDVPIDLTELTLHFSEPMGNGISINYGAGGKETYPSTGTLGWSDDHTSFRIKLALQPAHHYELIITGLGFSSKAGFSLKTYPISFDTK